MGRLLGFLLAATVACGAQTPVTTSGGITGALPTFSGTATLGTSVVTQTSGNIGVGTTSPASLFSVGAGSPFQVTSTGLINGTGGTSFVSTVGNTVIPNQGLFSTLVFKPVLSSNVNLGAYASGNSFSMSMTGTGTNSSQYLGVQNNHFTQFGSTGVQATAYVQSNSFEVGGGSTSYGNVYVTGSSANLYNTSSNITNLSLFNGSMSWNGGPYTGTLTNLYGLYLGNMTGATNNYAIYSAGGQNYFGGSMGIGTTTPGAKLEVNGSVKLTSGSGGSIVFPDGSVQSTAWTSNSATSVVGGSTPGTVMAGLMLNQAYVINTTGATTGHSFKIATLMANNAGDYDHLHMLVTVNNSWQATSNGYIDATFSNRGGFLYQYSLRGSPVSSSADLVAYNNGSAVDIYLTTPTLNAYTTISYTILENQQETVYTTPADVGTTFAGIKVFDAAYSNYAPATYIDDYGNFTFNGNVKIGGATGAPSLTFQDGSVQSVAWNGILGGGDYAESVDVIGDRAQYEPGDVLVIDPSSKGKFLKSAVAYSTAVMGIYSTRPGVVGRRQISDKSHMKEEVPMAMVGVVPTKASAESGPIKPGDLLVTSSKPGYAMKGTDRSLLTGAIIGKALEPLDSGTGVIEVAVAIQ